MSGISTVWEYTNGCAKKNRCDLAVYLLTMLSYSYGIIIYHTINAPGHGNNFIDRLNATDKRF